MALFGYVKVLLIIEYGSSCMNLSHPVHSNFQHWTIVTEESKRKKIHSKRYGKNRRAKKWWCV